MLLATNHKPKVPWKIKYLLTVMCMITTACGLTAFDCTHPNATQTPLSLLQPKGCIPPQEYCQDAAKIRIQLIQTSSARPVEAYTCRLTVTSKVTKCGFDRYIQLLRQTLFFFKFFKSGVINERKKGNKNLKT